MIHDMDPQRSAIDILHAIEADQAVFEPSVEGFSVWPAVRFTAWSMLARVAPVAPRENRRAHLSARPSTATIPLFALWSRIKQSFLGRGKRDFLFLTNEIYRSVMTPRGWWDVYLDDLATDPAMAGRVLRCEGRRFIWPRRHTATVRHLYTDGAVLRQILAGFRRPRSAAAKSGWRVAERFSRGLKRQGVEISESRLESFAATCARSAVSLREQMCWYGSVLDALAPKVFVLVNAYGAHGAVAAARKRGLPVVEFQHGVISRDHSGYIWSESARRFRTRMPVPTHLATYGDFWTELLLEGGFWLPEQVCSIGSARMDRLAASGGSPEAGGETVLVFTSQHPVRTEAIDLLRSFVTLADRESLSYRLTIKVHRGEARFIDEYRALTKMSNRVEVLSAYDADTLALIARADLHLSAWSTCHYEALGLGTPTAVLRFGREDRATELAGFANVHHVQNAGELLALVRDLPRRGEALPERARLFKPNAVPNAVHLLDQLAAGQP